MKPMTDKPADPKNGDLLVWRWSEPGHQTVYYPVKDIDEAKRTINRLAKKDLKDDSVTANAFGLVVYKADDDDWEDWEDEECRDINELIDEDDEKDEQERRDEKRGLHGAHLDHSN